MKWLKRIYRRLRYGKMIVGYDPPIGDDWGCEVKGRCLRGGKIFVEEIRYFKNQD